MFPAGVQANLSTQKIQADSSEVVRHYETEGLSPAKPTVIDEPGGGKVGASPWSHVPRQLGSTEPAHN